LLRSPPTGAINNALADFPERAAVTRLHLRTISLLVGTDMMAMTLACRRTSDGFTRR
jgi:hypothetical protein